MTYFAKIEGGTVTQGIVAEQSFVNDLDGVWVETLGTDYGGPERDLQNEANNPPIQKGYYAAIGFTYDSATENFSPPITQTANIETDPEILAAINNTKIAHIP